MVFKCIFEKNIGLFNVFKNYVRINCIERRKKIYIFECELNNNMKLFFLFFYDLYFLGCFLCIVYIGYYYRKVKILS